MNRLLAIFHRILGALRSVSHLSPRMCVGCVGAYLSSEVLGVPSHFAKYLAFIYLGFQK